MNTNAKSESKSRQAKSMTDLDPARAIHLFCFWCSDCDTDSGWVDYCSSICPLYLFRPKPRTNNRLLVREARQAFVQGYVPSFRPMYPLYDPRRRKTER